MLALPVWAQNYPITPTQRATATQVAQAGVPLSEIAANAPDSYLIKSGDTLWAISGMFLKSPWRWPELWGMNMSDIRNPHLIYPGQRLVLERNGGRAMLRLAGSGGDAIPTETIRVSPRTRFEALDSGALPAIKASVIEPFLAEPIVVDAEGLSNAPRIVAAQEGRVLLARGDRAYARGQNGSPLIDAPGKQQEFRVFRNATALKDPSNGEILGYEAQYVGKALLARSETTTEVTDAKGVTQSAITPATIDIVSAKEEMRVGDRLLPEPPRELVSYAPRAPTGDVNGRIVSVYGSAVVNAAQNQVVAISLGRRDGIEPGHVLAIMKDGARIVDKTDTNKPLLKLPDERNGLLMVFRSFDRVSYALVLNITVPVNIGDRLVNPL
ncbi:MAG: LysM domain-containing protein [Burkholderiaceae bacterium]